MEYGRGDIGCCDRGGWGMEGDRGISWGIGVRGENFEK